MFLIWRILFLIWRIFKDNDFSLLVSQLVWYTRTSWNTSEMSRPSKLTSLFLSSNVMCLMSHWQIIFSIRVSSFILTMWPVEIKGKIFKLPIKVINGRKLMSTQKKFKNNFFSVLTSLNSLHFTFNTKTWIHDRFFLLIG